MYKETSKSEQYLGRSGNYANRILRGGNLIESTMIQEENDSTILIELFNIISNERLLAVDRLRRSQEEKKVINRKCFGRDDSKLPADLAKARRVANDRWRRDLRDAERLEHHIDLIRGRLSALGVRTNPERGY